MSKHKYQDKVNASYEFGRETRIDATHSFLTLDNEKIIKIRRN